MSASSAASSSPSRSSFSSGTGFSGVWIPIVTPLRDGALDHAALAALVRRLKRDGVGGIVACGSTGEAAALDDDEQRAVLETVLEAADGLPVVMGVSGYHLPQMLDWVRALGQYPLAGLLVPPPNYIRPAQAGLLQWFHAIADAAAAPLVIYDIPYRTGARIDRDTLLTLARHPRVAALKDCGGDPGKTLALIDQGALQVLAGEDLQAFATLAQGGSGMIAASAHLRTADFVRLHALLRQGDLAPARVLWHSLVPLIEAVFAEPNPAPLKAALAGLGELQGGLRAPMTGCSAEHAARMHTLARVA